MGSLPVTMKRNTQFITIFTTLSRQIILFSPIPPHPPSQVTFEVTMRFLMGSIRSGKGYTTYSMAIVFMQNQTTRWYGSCKTCHLLYYPHSTASKRNIRSGYRYSKPCLWYIYVQVPQVLPHPSQRTSRTGIYRSQPLFPFPQADPCSRSSFL